MKRNSWPKTRGVAMNPVDHVRNIPATTKLVRTNPLTVSFSPTVVVTINISVKPLRSHDTLLKVKRRVSLRPEEPVYYVVPKRRRTRRLCGVPGFVSTGSRWSVRLYGWIPSYLDSRKIRDCSCTKSGDAVISVASNVNLLKNVVLVAIM